MPPHSFIKNGKSKQKQTTSVLFIILVFLAATAIGVYFYVSSPNKSLAQETVVRVGEGMSIKEITELLEGENVVKSSLYLYFILRNSFEGTSIQAGNYLFPENITAQRVAELLVAGENREPDLTLTLPEGFRARDLKVYLPSQFSSMSNEILDQYDGTLFPDTYYFHHSDTADDILAVLARAQSEKLISRKEAIERSGYTKNEILVLASLIEREASDPVSRRIVSGILHNRLTQNIPLQVDATFHYVFGKTSAQLTREDLQIDSLYNTYTNKGLPPHAIANPGIDAIDAALDPTVTEYLYYLTGTDGNFYYALDFEAHKRNKEKYLK